MSDRHNGHVGKLDRLVRIALAFILLGFALFCPFAKSLGPITVWLSGSVGAILLITALLGRCPLCRILGVRT